MGSGTDSEQKAFRRAKIAASAGFTLLLLASAACDSMNPFSPLESLWESSDESPAAVEADGTSTQQKTPPSEGGLTPEAEGANPTAETGEETGDAAGGGGGVPFDLHRVRWLHEDVSGWKETGNLRAVRVSGETITLDYDKAKVWPGINHSGAFVNANPWVFVEVDGSWYAATWEWLRFGQRSKSVRSVAGDHIKKHPLGDFRPRSGVRYGFMVSGLARDSARNVKERTQVVMYRWP